VLVWVGQRHEGEEKSFPFSNVRSTLVFQQRTRRQESIWVKNTFLFCHLTASHANNSCVVEQLRRRVFCSQTSYRHCWDFFFYSIPETAVAVGFPGGEKRRGMKRLHPAVVRLFHSAGASWKSAFRPAQTQASLPLNTGRPRLVVLGSGWGGARLLRDIDPTKYDISVISPRNHMVFTPLLSSTCVGTLETRAVVQTITDVQKALKQ